LNEKKLIIDASVAVDLFASRNLHRTEAAEKLFRCAVSSGIHVYAPRLFLVEVAGVLVRFLPPNLVKDVIKRLSDEIIIIGDDLYFGKSVEIAIATGSRGADAYYIGLAEILDAPLVTSDKVQAQNAKKAGAKAFYILNGRELEELIKLLGCKE
jgi:predicted nucleic acid-binding protein